MAQKLRQRRRTRKRHGTPFRAGLELGASQGHVAWALCHPEAGELGPICRTTFVRSATYAGMDDVELRGFPGEEIKFIRNVVTQYHVRIGCENLAHSAGRFELMRVLQRWNLSSLPATASIRSATLTLCQEDHGSRRHYWPLHRPTTFYLYAVKRPWNPGRGGTKQDNLSPPEEGDAWWREARAEIEKWSEPGCGYAHDDDPQADRAAHPLASATLHSTSEPLVFSGPRLAAHIEEQHRQGKPLEVLLKAGDTHELIPGSVCCFYSAESGEDEGTERRPQLEVVWQAPSVASGRSPFVLEPATRTTITLSEPQATEQPYTLYATVDLDAGAEQRPSVERLTPEVTARGWLPAEGASPATLALPIQGRPTTGFGLELSTQLRPVLAGTSFEATLFQTWTPRRDDAERIAFPFVFRSPSGRELQANAHAAGEHRYVCTFVPDEPGVWHYTWKARPDRRLPPQDGSGVFTVIVPPGQAGEQALGTFLGKAAVELHAGASLLERRRTHYRLTAIERELFRLEWAAGRAGSDEEQSDRREMLKTLERLIAGVR